MTDCSRRALLLGSVAVALAGAIPARATEPQLSDDGLYRQPWFIKSFLDLTRDYANAVKSGKNFAILWEMKGCPWCKLLHTVNFVQPAISTYIQENFAILQLNLNGMRDVKDFDKEQLPEKMLSEKYAINSTPTLQFFKGSLAAMPMELGRTGYLKPDEFLQMLHFVREKGYEEGTFDTWLARSRSKS